MTADLSFFNVAKKFNIEFDITFIIEFNIERKFYIKKRQICRHTMVKKISSPLSKYLKKLVPPHLNTQKFRFLL